MFPSGNNLWECKPFAYASWGSKEDRFVFEDTVKKELARISKARPFKDKSFALNSLWNDGDRSPDLWSVTPASHCHRDYNTVQYIQYLKAPGPHGGGGWPDHMCCLWPEHSNFLQFPFARDDHSIALLLHLAHAIFELAAALTEEGTFSVFSRLFEF